MPSQIALIICILFVLWLLRLERNQTLNVSFVSWLPTIWMLCIATKPLGTWFGISDDPEGNPLDRVFFSGLLCLGLLILVLRRFRWSRAIKENPWLMLLIAYMLISVLWSDIPFTSFKRWIRELLAVVMAFLVLTEQNPRQTLQSILKRTVYILIPFSVLLVRFFPEYGREYGRWFGEVTWIGVTLQKNGLGRLCLIAAFFQIWSIIRRWRGRDTPVSMLQTYADVFILFLTLYLLKGPENDAFSATAITSLAVGLAMFFSLLWMGKRKSYLGVNTLMAIMALIIGFGVVLPIVGGTPVGGFTSSLGRDETLTGRTEIWKELLPFIEKQPIFGLGFGDFWTSKTRLEYHVSEAHNGYLDVLLGLGSFGLLLLVVFLLSFCRKVQRELSNDFDWASLCICFLLMALLHNASESSINTFASQLSAVILFLAVSNKTVTSDTPGSNEYWEIL
jgi:exopolysaccharide production protein ExoQ